MKKQSALLIILVSLISNPLLSQQTFEDVAPSLGITGIVGLGHSVAWGDIDKDGDPDLGLSDQSGNGYWFFRNDITSFSEITSEAGLNGQVANKTIIADFTGDGFNDLLIRNFGGFGEKSNLFKNNGDGTFTNITAASNLPIMGVYSAADFNNDGILDVLSLDIIDNGNISLQYGNGDGTFQPIEQIGVVWGYTPLAVFDFDRDGFIDVFWPTDVGATHPTTLLKNNGDGTFTNVTASTGINFTSSSNASLDIGDLNNDGFIDMYIGGLDAKLYINNGDGTFSDITASSGANGQNDADRTVTFADYNNDGWLDMFTSWHLEVNQMFSNNADNTFTNVANELELTGGGLLDFFGAGWADYNNDGAIDLFAAGHFDEWVLLENQDAPGNSLFINLEGVQSNFNAIGAQADLWIDGQRISRNVLPDPGVQDYSDLRLHFGMGNATVADSIVINWPSGLEQIFYDVSGNNNITIIEGEDILANQNPIIKDLQITLSPNPTKDFSKLTFNLQKPEVVQVNLYSITGQMLAEIANTSFTEGNQEISFSTESLSPGLYFIAIKTNESSYSVKMVKQ